MKRMHHFHIKSWAVLSLILLCGGQALRLDAAAARYPQAGISLEFIGQGLVVTPSEVYQYGYFTYVAGVEDLFSGTPQNESTAFFTFFNALGTPGQKLSWTAFGRPNPAPNPGQFVYAGTGISHPPVAPGLKIGRLTAANEVQLEVENSPGARSLLESSPDFANWTLLAAVDHTQPKVVVTDPVTNPVRFYRAATE
jgi:hypothetical protein